MGTVTSALYLYWMGTLVGRCVFSMGNTQPMQLSHTTTEVSLSKNDHQPITLLRWIYRLICEPSEVDEEQLIYFASFF